MPARRVPSSTVVFVATAVSWLGLCVHNAGSLGTDSLLAGDTIYPTVAYLVIAAAWLSPWRVVAAWILLGWAWLHLLGGGLLSALPWWEQSLDHLAFHVAYGLLQLPLIVVMTRYLRGVKTMRPRRSTRSSTAASAPGIGSADRRPSGIRS
jgi:hypothetical protein